MSQGDIPALVQSTKVETVQTCNIQQHNDNANMPILHRYNVYHGLSENIDTFEDCDIFFCDTALTLK